MGDARRYAAGALATMGSICVSMSIFAASASAAPSSPSPATATTPIISTAAGNGHGGFSGDGGSATSAQVNAPTGVAEDILGNVYIGDTGNNRIRKVTTAGIITTIAGNGTFGFGGDGHQATSAKLAAPTGTAVDSAGDVFIADSGNNRIRKVAPNGIITTYAGNGNCNWTGDGKQATKAALCLPTGIALDSANDLFIADSGNNVVREVTSAGIISTFAGTGGFGSSGDGGLATKARFEIPTGIAVDNQVTHNVYIADTVNNKIRVVNASGIISTFAGNGTSGFGGDGGKAPLAKLNTPTGLGVDPLGNVYVSDTGNNRIRVVIPLGDIFTYAGTGVAGYSGDGGAATAAMINAPTGAVAVDGQNVYFSDTGNNRVRRVVGGPPPNIPETPFNVALLPLSALALLGGGYVILRRRRRTAGAVTA